MIVKSHIHNELHRINRLYVDSQSGSNRELPIFFSKLALLECTGWIEESIDDIIEKCYKRNRIRAIDFMESSIKKIHSFDYTDHFRNMFVSLIGIAGFEKIERKVGLENRIKLKAHLNTLKLMRNDHAHTTLQGKGKSKRLHSPSVIIAMFSEIYTALKDYEKQLKFITVNIK